LSGANIALSGYSISDHRIVCTLSGAIISLSEYSISDYRIVCTLGGAIIALSEYSISDYRIVCTLGGAIIAISGYSISDHRIVCTLGGANIALSEYSISDHTFFWDAVEHSSFQIPDMPLTVCGKPDNHLLMIFYILYTAIRTRPLFKPVVASLHINRYRRCASLGPSSPSTKQEQPTGATLTL
jgi:hypothetical protein